MQSKGEARSVGTEAYHHVGANFGPLPGPALTLLREYLPEPRVCDSLGIVLWKLVCKFLLQGRLKRASRDVDTVALREQPVNGAS